MSYAVRICSGPCIQDVCACTPRVCDVEYDWDTTDLDTGEYVVPNWQWGGEGVGMVPDPGYALDDDPHHVMPCVYGQLGVREHRMTDEPEPRRHHLHEVIRDHGTGATEWHEWSDGDTDCVVSSAVDSYADEEPITINLTNGEPK